MGSSVLPGSPQTLYEDRRGDKGVTGSMTILESGVLDGLHKGEGE